MKKLKSLVITLGILIALTSCKKTVAEVKEEAVYEVDEPNPNHQVTIKLPAKIGDSKPSEVVVKEDGTETKVMTYKWCECNDSCQSLFIDDQGNEYNFGDISNKSDIDFQCYPNNSHGGVSDDLREQKFRVTYIKISDNDLELVKISPINNNS